EAPVTEHQTTLVPGDGDALQSKHRISPFIVRSLLIEQKLNRKRSGPSHACVAGCRCSHSTGRAKQPTRCDRGVPAVRVRWNARRFPAAGHRDIPDAGLAARVVTSRFSGEEQAWESNPRPTE